MPASRSTAIITYNNVDGACAAAMALLKFPKADLRISSARRIGKTFAELLGEKVAPAEVHVCGLGVYCDWSELRQPARKLKEKGCRIFWYCGRGYLEPDRAQFEEFSTPVFYQFGSNTKAVGQALGVLKHPRADMLVKLAEHDKWVPKADHAPEPEESKWIDLLEAATAAFFKYRDMVSFASSVHKLVDGTFTQDDERAVAVFRKTGYKYMLHGHSPQLRKLKEFIYMCAKADEPVLILGETGVGKEHVARLIHEGSSRATESFIPVNCAIFAGNPGLANSNLFGHLKGAFTDALAKRDGAFVTADGGVLFLDELGELPLEVQAKFLRVLDDGLIVPEGSDIPVPNKPVSVRVVAATNRDLPAMIRKKQFRADLFYRLSTWRISIPPLRERKEDIEDIIEHTLSELPETVKLRKLTEKEYEILCSYDWPGNVRQLDTVLKRTLRTGQPMAEVLEEEKALGSLEPEEDSPEERDFLPSRKGQLRPMEDIRRAYAKKALELCNGNWTETAKTLGVAPNTLRALVASGYP